MIKVKCPVCGKNFNFDERYEICECPRCHGNISLSPKLRKIAENQHKRDWIDELNDFDTFFED